MTSVEVPDCHARVRCYGYTKDTDDDAPSELAEVTIQARPDTLRDIIRCLTHVAEQMEKHGENFGHEHFEDFCSRSDSECRLVIAGIGYK